MNPPTWSSDRVASYWNNFDAHDLAFKVKSIVLEFYSEFRAWEKRGAFKCGPYQFILTHNLHADQI